MQKKILLAALAASLFLVAAPAAAQDVSVNAEPQATDGDSVTIDSVEIDADGWVAVYSESVDEGPNFDDLKGTAEVDDGEHDDVVVETEGLDENAFYYAVLHYEEDESGEFNYPGDSEVTQNDSTVQDDFFVAVGTRDIHQSYAEANQQRRSLREQADTLDQQLSDLEDQAETSGTEDEVQDQIDTVRDNLESTRDSIDQIDSTIQDTEDLLQEIDENGTDSTGGDGDTGDDGNASDGNGSETDGDTQEEPQGLPGFTAVTALVAGLTAAVFLGRRD